MSNELIGKNIGHATAYAYAKAHGYEGTEEDFAQMLANYDTLVEQASGYAESAGESASEASGYADDASASATAADQAAQRISGITASTTVAGMTDTTKVYVYLGSETGYTSGNWYYYSGSAWVSGGVYQSTALVTDTTLTQSGMAADAKATGDEVADLKEDISAFYIEKTTSGKIIRLENALGDAQAVADSLVTVGNQNIMANNLGDTSNNGISYVRNSDGSFTITGTATSNVSLYINSGVFKIPQGKYTLSGCPSGGGSSTYRLVCNYYANNETNTWLIDDGNGATGNLTEDIDYIRAYLFVKSGQRIFFSKSSSFSYRFKSHGFSSFFQIIIFW